MSNDKANFPGYPHYPDNEDILRPQNNNGKVNAADSISQQVATETSSDADITTDDLKMLDAAEQNMGTIDSLNLQHAALDNADEDGDPLNETGSFMEDMTGEGLDVPGAENDDAAEAIGEEDEENNYYSLGGDLHESQEETKE